MCLLPISVTAQDNNSNLVGFIAAHSAVNVRNRPNGAAISSLPPNMSVPIVDKNGDGTWFSVRLPDGRVGWVAASVMRVMESSVPFDLPVISPDNAHCLQKIAPLASTLSTGFAFSPDGRLIASYSWLNTIEIYDVRTKIKIATLTKHTSNISGVAFSPDGREMASSSWDGSVKIWDTQTWGERTELLGHTDAVLAVAFSPDGQLLASVGRDGLLNIWNLQTVARVQMIKVPRIRGARLAFSPDSTKVATAGDYTDSYLRMWDVATGKQLWQHYGVSSLSFAFSPDGNTIVLASGGGVLVSGLDVQTAITTFIVNSIGTSAVSASVNPADSLIAVGAWQPSTFTLVDPKNRRILFTAPTEGHTGLGAAFSPDGRVIATTDNDHAIELWGVPASGCKA